MLLLRQTEASRRRWRSAVGSGGLTADLLEGDDPTGVYDDMVKLIKDEDYCFELAPPGSPHLGKSNGRTTRRANSERLVRVRDDISDAHRVKTTIHELAHTAVAISTTARTRA